MESILTLIGLIVVFAIYGFVRLKVRKQFTENVSKQEQYKGLALYAFVYGLGIYLAYTISGMISEQLQSNTYQWIILIGTIVVVIIVIVQILNRLLSEQLRKVFL